MVRSSFHFSSFAKTEFITSFVFTFFVYHLTDTTDDSPFQTSTPTTSLIVMIGQYTHMDCPVTNISQSIWIINNLKVNGLFYAGLNPIRGTDWKNVMVFGNNYTLKLGSTEIRDEGLYTCQEYGQKVAEYSLKVIGNFSSFVLS